MQRKMVPQTTNEQLCALAQQGSADAQNELIEKNLGFINEIASEVYSEQGLASGILGITFDDLIQEGRIGLWKCIEKFDPALGASFLTYAKPSIRNAMMDLVREQFGQTEIELTNDEDIPLKRIYLDDINYYGEDGLLQIELIADPYAKTPEQIVIEAETMQELYAALRAIEKRDRGYLLYRYGFEGGEEHPLTETAKHFLLSESRARITEKTALKNMRNEFFGLSGKSQK